ncbi:hypothetical protein DPMN_134724 [Dreissena polymorpha]|uniref:Secreted protein n=1 Tax=Dreissena polymorpha TaxID=45954 RepID=A0A9D4JF53_DREPO|nr:hypothetical protein DPMN_134724 [Dreissena polymorpha]
MQRLMMNNMVDIATTTLSCLLTLANIQAQRTVMTSKIDTNLGITNKKKVTHKLGGIKGTKTFQ